MELFSIPKKIKACIFDIDNTVYRSYPYTLHQEEVLVRRLAKELDTAFDDAARRVSVYRNNYANNNGGHKPSLGNTFVHFGVSIETSVKWREELIKPEDFLTEDKSLQNLFIDWHIEPLVFVTNNPSKIGARTLQALGVNPENYPIIGLDHSLASKPNTKAFELAVKELAVPVDTIVSIGDRYAVDIEPFVGMGGGGVLLESMEELYSLAQTLN